MNDNILSIVLFGSYSRNDNDEASDLDLCVVTRESVGHDINYEHINKLIAHFGSSSISLVSYPDSLISAMLDNGSLFLWHLKLEGQVLYGEDYFINKIKSLKPFTSHYEEVLYHAEMFEEINNCWKILNIPNELDLSILFTLTRNTCMVLSHWAGKPSFGRLDSFSSAKEIYPDLPMAINEYIQLSRWKMLYERNHFTGFILPSPEEYNNLLSKVGGVLTYALQRLRQ